MECLELNTRAAGETDVVIATEEATCATGGVARALEVMAENGMWCYRTGVPLACFAKPCLDARACKWNT
jgi:hypothetical protein